MRPGGAEQPRGDRDRKAAGLVVDDLAFADVNPGSRGDSEAGHPRGDLVGAVSGASRPDEAREEAVAGGVVLGASPVRERAADRGVMSEHELLPAAVAELRLRSGRVDDVGEEDRGEDRCRDPRLLDSGELAHDRHLRLDLQARPTWSTW